MPKAPGLGLTRPRTWFISFGIGLIRSIGNNGKENGNYYSILGLYIGNTRAHFFSLGGRLVRR